MFYDPMIAKLITYGKDRDEAIEEMGRALDAYEVSGIAHNINFLNAVCNHPRFKAGKLTTGFIAEEYPDGFHGAPLDEDTYEKLVAVATLIHLRSVSRSLKNVVEKTAEDWVVSEGKEKSFDITAEDAKSGIDVKIGDRVIAVRSKWAPGKRRIKAKVNGEKLIAQVSYFRGAIRLTHGGAEVELSVRTPAAAKLAEIMPVKVAPDMSKFLLCPMPGMVVSVNVNEGDEVKAGQALAVVEAMKMENILRAEQDGVVSAVKAGAGDVLAVDDVILEFE
jgi:propionyl-CoA carboxylase alpha chain